MAREAAAAALRSSQLSLQSSNVKETRIVSKILQKNPFSLLSQNGLMFVLETVVAGLTCICIVE